MTSTTATLDRIVMGRSAAPSPAVNPRPIAAALVAVSAMTWYLSSAVAWRQGALLLVGVGAGVALYHAAFGFTSAWRVLIARGRGVGLRAQLLMLAVTCTVFYPVLAHGRFFGQAVRGSVAPVGLPVVVGAFLFGVGMQLGGGCASGTLYTAGGGSVRMLVTLASFIAGSVIGVMHMPLWEHAPTWGPISLVATFGAWTALVITLAVFGLAAWISIVFERRRHGAFEPLLVSPVGARPISGPWPLAAGALALASVNVATLALAGRPWGVTSAFALWGSKALATAGVGVAAWPYWQPAAQAAALRGSIAGDVTSVMDVGIMLGALAAAGLAGQFAPTWRVPTRSVVASVIGGLLLGYGARIAYGCNIGAFFSGVASSSVHGWVWFVAAFAGSIFGTRLRPLFGLRV